MTAKPRRNRYSGGWTTSLPSAGMAAANPAVAIIEAHPEPHMGLRPVRAVAAVCLCGVFAFLNLYVDAAAAADACARVPRERRRRWG